MVICHTCRGKLLLLIIAVMSFAYHTTAEPTPGIITDYNSHSDCLPLGLLSGGGALAAPGLCGSYPGGTQEAALRQGTTIPCTKNSNTYIER